MKKLKLLAALALLPALLVGCGKSEEDKTKDEVRTIQQHLDAYMALEKEIVELQIPSVESASSDDLKFLREKVAAQRGFLQLAFDLDDKAKNVSIADRAQLEVALQNANNDLKKIDAELASRLNGKAEPKTDTIKYI